MGTQPTLIASIATAEITPFVPGAGPPPVRIPILLIAIRVVPDALVSVLLGQTERAKVLFPGAISQPAESRPGIQTAYRTPQRSCSRPQPSFRSRPGLQNPAGSIWSYIRGRPGNPHCRYSPSSPASFPYLRP